MNKRVILGASLVTLLAFGLLIAGCGDGGEDTAAEAESAAPTEEAAPAAETVAVHDCAGGCGMKAMPEDKMTEIDGKFYCPGCAKKIQEEGHGEG